MSKGQRIGYVRVSTADQNVERQLDGSELDRVFTDKASGKDTKRPKLQAALEYLRDGGHWEIIAYAPIEHEAAWRGWLTTPDGGAR